MDVFSRGLQRPSQLQFLSTCLSVSAHSSQQLRTELTTEGAVNWSRTLELAGAHLVTPTLGRALGSKGLISLLGDDERDYLDAVMLLNRERNDVLRSELIHIISALNQIGVTPLLLKGAISLALPDHYPGAYERVIGDLDIVVGPDRAIDAQRRIAELGYCEASYGREWTTSEERDRRHHHLAPMIHQSLPVCVEVHTRIVSDWEDDQALAASMRAFLWQSPGGGQAYIPDPATRIAHNFIHSHVSHGLGARHLFNLRHLHEFASLVSHYRTEFAASDVRAAVTSKHQDGLSEYWALAEAWLDAPFPDNLPRSPGERRELWLAERVMQHRMLRRGFDTIAFASSLPTRVKLHVSRMLQVPGYPREFARRVRNRLFSRPSDDSH